MSIFVPSAIFSSSISLVDSVFSWNRLRRINDGRAQKSEEKDMVKGCGIENHGGGGKGKMGQFYLEGTRGSWGKRGCELVGWDERCM